MTASSSVCLFNKEIIWTKSGRCFQKPNISIVPFFLLLVFFFIQKTKASMNGSNDSFYTGTDQKKNLPKKVIRKVCVTCSKLKVFSIALEINKKCVCVLRAWTFRNNHFRNNTILITTRIEMTHLRGSAVEYIFSQLA